MEVQPDKFAYLEILLLAGFLIPAILFLVSQYKTLKAVSPQNRLMRPGLVWLQVFPLGGQIWQFFVVGYIADSIRKEFDSVQDDSILGISDAVAVEESGKRPTFGIGIAYCTLITVGGVLNLMLAHFQIKILGTLCSLSGMICWIIYWVQLVQYKRKLQLLHE